MVVNCLRGLTESEKLSLEGTFSKDCHVNVSLLPVGANISVHFISFLPMLS